MTVDGRVPCAYDTFLNCQGTAFRSARSRSGALMADQLEELIKEIAAKHGIAISHDDPILVLQTINNRLMKDTCKAQQV
jgi:hypothetical protein